VSIAANSSAKTVADAINGQSDATGVKAIAYTTATLSDLSGTVGSGQTISFSLSGKNQATVTYTVPSGETASMSGLADAINAVKDTTGITASYNKTVTQSSL